MVERVRPQVMILDMRLPDTDGLSVLRRVRQVDAADSRSSSSPPSATSQSAVEAMKLGAATSCASPTRWRTSTLAVEAAARTLPPGERARACTGARRWRPLHGRGDHRRRSAPMQRGARPDRARSSAAEATSVLIDGRERAPARNWWRGRIHYRGDRAAGPAHGGQLLARSRRPCSRTSCSGTSGAPSPTPRDLKKGLVELCDGGTLFLDEVADMSLPTQAKLLRFIDHRNFKRVGGAEDIARGHPHRGGLEQGPRERGPQPGASAATCTSASRW